MYFNEDVRNKKIEKTRQKWAQLFLQWFSHEDIVKSNDFIFSNSLRISYRKLEVDRIGCHRNVLVVHSVELATLVEVRDLLVRQKPVHFVDSDCLQLDSRKLWAKFVKWLKRKIVNIHEHHLTFLSEKFLSKLTRTHRFAFSSFLLAAKSFTNENNTTAAADTW